MRKFLFFLCALLCIGVGGAWADVTMPTLTTNPEEPILYKMESYNRGGYITYNGANANITHESLSYYSLWYFMKNGDGVSIIPYADPSVKLETQNSATTDGATWYIVASNYVDGYFCISKTSSYNSDGSLQNCLDANNSNSGIGTWAHSSSDNEGTAWSFEVVSSSESSELKDALKTPVFDEAVLKVSNVRERVVVPAISAEDNEHWYLITQTRGGETPIYNNGTGENIMRASSSTTVETFDGLGLKDNLQYLVRFFAVDAENDLYTMQFANGEFIDANLKPSRTGGIYAFYNTVANGEHFGWNEKGKETSHRQINNNGAGQNILFYGNGLNTNDADNFNNVWMLYHVTLQAAVPVTYALVYNGKVFENVETSALPGSAVSLSALYQYAHCSYSYYSDADCTETATTIGQEGGTIYVKVELNEPYPFEIASDYESAKWYTMTIRGNKAVSKGSSEPYTLNTDISRDMQIVDETYHWAFVGNPYRISVYNKSTGSTYTLANANNNAVMREGIHTWEASNNLDGFVLKESGTSNNYINDAGSGGKLQFWNSTLGATDNGSTFRVTEITFEDLYAAANAALEATDYGIALGQYHVTTGDVDELKAAIASLVEQGNYEEAVAAIQDMLANTELNLPEAGTFLRIKSAGKTIATYLTSNNVDISTNETPNYRSAYTQNTDEIDGKETILYYDGNSLLSYATGYRLLKNSDGQGFIVWADAPTADYTTVAFNAAANGTKGKYNVIYNGSRYLYTQERDNKLFADAGSSATAEGYNFELEEVTELPVEIGESGWATFAAPVATVVPEGVTAYTATAEGLNLTLTAIEAGSIIPANTGVLLSGSNGSHDFEVTTGGSVSDNVFTGTTEATTVDVNSTFVLANKNDELGFYLLQSTEMPAFKAYIAKSAVPQATESSVFRIVLGDDDITAITDATVAGAEGTATYYDLQGRRVAAPQKGQLYIVNGKKVLY